MSNPPNRSQKTSSQEELIACEQKTWNLIQLKDLDGFAAYLAEDFYDIFPDGTERNKSELLGFLKQAELKDYHLSNFRVTMLNEDAAIITYHVDANAIVQGAKVTMKNSVTSGWVRRSGKWMNVSAVAISRA
jgi:hypothetical protein